MKKNRGLSNDWIIVMTCVVLAVIIIISVVIGNIKNSLYTLELNGDANVVVYKGGSYEDPGAKVYDKNKKDYSDKIVVESNLNLNKTGQYEIVYKYNDIYVKRIVKVINKKSLVEDDNKNDEDKKNEIIQKGETIIALKGAETVYIDLNGNYKEEGFTAVDTVDGDIKKYVKVTHNIDNTKEGTYQIVYTVKNSSGITTSVKRNVVVVNAELHLSVVAGKYTNENVDINVKVTDDYFDYLLLPDGSKVDSKNYVYSVSSNGTYKFKSYSSKGIVREAEIKVNNIDKTNPNVSCSAEYKNGKTNVIINANDNVEVSRYIVNGKDYSSNVVILSAFVANNNVVVYDSAGNSASCSCQLDTKVFVDSIKNDGVIVTVKGKTIDSSIAGYYFSYTNNLPDKATGGYVATSKDSIDVVRLPGTTYVWAEDSNGNISEVKTITLNNNVLPMTMSGYTVLKGTKLSDYLKGKGWSVEELNKLMARSVRAAGLYSKTGAATAGVTLQVVLIQKYKIKIPYWRGGKTSSIGAYGGWGMYRENPTYEGYNYYGMDCDGFVNWSFHNTGIVYNDMLANTYYYWNGLPLSKENGEVGDVIRRDGHVALIVGKADDGFIIAEAYGEKVGIIINKHPYTKTSGFTIIKGERLVSTYGHLNNYPTGF